MFNLCSSTWPKSQLRADWANPAGFFVQPDRGGGAVVSVPVSHARIHVIPDKEFIHPKDGHHALRSRKKASRCWAVSMPGRDTVRVSKGMATAPTRME